MHQNQIKCYFFISLSPRCCLSHNYRLLYHSELQLHQNTLTLSFWSSITRQSLNLFHHYSFQWTLSKLCLSATKGSKIFIMIFPFNLTDFFLQDMVALKQITKSSQNITFQSYFSLIKVNLVTRIDCIFQNLGAWTALFTPLWLSWQEFLLLIRYHLPRIKFHHRWHIHK